MEVYFSQSLKQEIDSLYEKNKELGDLIENLSGDSYNELFQIWEEERVQVQPAVEAIFNSDKTANPRPEEKYYWECSSGEVYTDPVDIIYWKGVEEQENRIFQELEGQ